MDITSLSASTSQTLGAQLMQQLQATGPGSQDLTGLSSLLEDNLSLSPAAKQLAQAPTAVTQAMTCLLYTSPSPRDRTRSRMPSSA